MTISLPPILLCLFVINLGIAFGAGLYETRIEFRRWLSWTAATGYRWNAAAAREADSGLRFWVYVTTVPLTLLTLANLAAAWLTQSPARGWWLAAGFIALAERLFTFAYFIPTMIKLQRSELAATEAVTLARQWGRLSYLRQALVLVAWLAALGTFSRIAPGNTALSVAESLYADLRVLRDRIEVTTAAGQTTTGNGTPLSTLVARHNRLREHLAPRLRTIDSTTLNAEDARALHIMRRTLATDLGPIPESSNAPADGKPDCAYDAGGIGSGPKGLDSLRKRIYDCYAWAQSHVAVGGDTLDRLSILGALGRTEDRARRRQFFLALDPVWRSINGDNGPASPYRRLIALELGRRDSAESQTARQALASGVPPDSLQRWLLAILETWRAEVPDSLIEPWDWYYETGRTSRRLSPRISRERLIAINSEVYQSLGADLQALRVQYDLDPRDGKTPVAFCTFGGRPRWTGGAWSPGEPWVFATYRGGGLDNLNELLHETGHAIHIAALRTRPAFADWPDSDPFTEAVADFLALEVYEPAWQQHWLGDSVPLADGLRARYGGIVFDVAWALFEMELQREPGADPNQVWTRLTRDYLRIRPHPELSWWAMRGQLVDAPGYMMNYAVGSILIAAIRARTRTEHGAFSAGDPAWYGWIAPRLFRFGLERPTREVIERFLGGPVLPAALLEDMERMSAPR